MPEQRNESSAACGHDPAQYVTGGEGTAYCPACEGEGRPAATTDSGLGSEKQGVEAGVAPGEGQDASPAAMPKVGEARTAAPTSGGTAVPPGNCPTHGYHGRTYCPRCSTSVLPPPPLGQAPTAASPPRYCPRCRRDARTVIRTYSDHKGGANCGVGVDTCARHGVALRERTTRG